VLGVVAALYDRAMRDVERAGLGAWRKELLADLSGHVLEIGAGTGRNLAYYPASVERLVLVEPDRHMRRRLEQRLADAPVPPEVVEAPAEDLPFPDASFDTVVSTLVLCSVRDPARAAAEAGRVLRPSGRLVLIEHVAAVDRPRRLAWQRRLEPLWRPLAGNCHLTRRTDEILRRAGFELVALERASMRKAPPIVRPTIRGSAVWRGMAGPGAVRPG
jgi:ubiquinone/menaquinone biosynthesis C-methylase UbiE